MKAIHGVASPGEISGGRPRISWGELALSLALLALGVVVVVDGVRQPASTSASGVGAGFFPIVVGSVLIVVSALLVVQVLRGKRGESEDSDGDVDTSKLALWQMLVTGAAVVWFIVTLDLLGYIIASTVTFWAIAFAMGARHHIRNALIAVLLSTSVYLLFTQLLRIDLPGGVLERLF
jgi:putative tricarboxylic transport membrane protein